MATRVFIIIGIILLVCAIAWAIIATILWRSAADDGRRKSELADHLQSSLDRISAENLELGKSNRDLKADNQRLGNLVDGFERERNEFYQRAKELTQQIRDGLERAGTDIGSTAAGLGEIADGLGRIISDLRPD